MTDRSPDERPGIEGLLRATLADDLPAQVEDRLNAQVGRFLASRRAGGAGSLAARIASWQSGLVARAAAAAALLACGIGLHVAGSSSLLAAPVGRMQDSVAVWRAIRSASSMACGGAALSDLGSPADFADRVYRRWVLVDSEVEEADARWLTFRSPEDGAQYTLVVDRQSMLPRRVVKASLSGAAPPRGSIAAYDATCTWGSPAPKE